MVVVSVRVQVKASSRDTFLEMARVMVECSREEKGCIRYSVYADPFDSGGFVYLEEWESHEALKAHTRTAHYESYIAQLPQVLTQPSEIRIYSVSRVELR